MSDFNFAPSKHVPFRDKEVLERVRKIKRADFENHPNPNLKIKVMKDFDVWFMFMMDMFFRIKEAMEADKKLVMILPQPWPLYKSVAYIF